MAFDPGNEMLKRFPGWRGPTEFNLNLDAALFFVLILCLVRLWLMPLASSLWVDETVTAFIVRLGTDHPSLAVASQVTESNYYFLPRAATALLGFSEVAYRLPSLLVQGTALFLVSRLAVRLIDPQSGWFAAFACLSLRGFNYEAVDARPYALGICLVSLSFYLLVRWFDSGSRWDAVFFIVSAGLLWRVHLVFWPPYIVFASYAVMRLVGRETLVRWGNAVLAFILLGLVLAPILPDAISLLKDAGAHVITNVPSYRTLGRSIQMEALAYCVVGAWLFGGKRMRNPVRGVSISLCSNRQAQLEAPKKPMSPASLVLIIGWWLCPPLCLFAFSRTTGESIFVPRYLSIALPGAALAATAVTGLVVTRARWKPISLILGLAALIIYGQWRHAMPIHDSSDWRGAAAKLNEIGVAPGTPVICPSPFIEARPPAWQPDYPLPGFLYAHLQMYPIAGKPILFPYDTSPEAEEFARQLTWKSLLPAGRFYLYGGRHVVHFWENWFSARPELAGWHRRSLGSFGDIEVVIVENQ